MGKSNTESDIFAVVKKEAGIEKVVSWYVELRPSGRYLVGRCPFHVDDTPSFSVTPSRGIFYCFGCKKHGDVIDFVSEIEGIRPIEAAQLIAKRLGIKVEPREISGSSKREVLALSTAMEISHGLLLSSKGVLARRYLSERSVNEAMISRFKIGLFPTGTALRSLVRKLLDAGFDYKTLQNAGILAEGGTSVSSIFENRILFPIRSSAGIVRGFGARIFLDGDRRAKYVNSRETKLFKKSRELYGIDVAVSEIKSAGYAILVEGYLDVILMHSVGFGNTVGVLGTAVTEEHLSALRRITGKIVLMLDSDFAGREAIQRVFGLRQAAEMEMLVAEFPDGIKDPGEAVSMGVDVVSVVQGARPYYDFFVENFLTDENGIPREEALLEVGRSIAAVQQVSPIVAAIMKERFSAAAGMDQKGVEIYVERAKEENAARIARGVAPGENRVHEKQEGGVEKDEALVISAVCQLAEVGFFGFEWIGELMGRRARDLLMSTLSAGGENKISALLAAVDGSPASDTIVASVTELPDSSPEELLEIVKFFVRRRWPQTVRRILRATGGKESKEVIEAREKLEKLKRKVSDFLE